MSIPKSSATPPREPLLPPVHVGLTVLLPILLPLGVLLVQAMLWDLIAPYGWIAFLPAVALCGWLSGLRGGLFAALLSVAGAEWLLTLQAGPAPGPEARAFSGLMFSALAAGVVIVLDQARRERISLHLAIQRLQVLAAGLRESPPAAPWLPWQRNYAGDLAALATLGYQLEWRRQCLQGIEQPLAVFARNGRCLFTNAAFQRIVGLEAGAPTGRNGLESGHFPGTGLALALHRLLEQPPPRVPGSVQLGAGIEGQIIWLGEADGGVAMCCGEALLRPAPAAAAGGIIRIDHQPASAERAAPPAALPPLALQARPDTAVDGAPLPGRAAEPAARAAADGADQAPRHQPGRRRTIAGLRCLVVDDQEINRSLLREILRLDGAQVTACASGREAFAQVSANPEAFDVVLMDLQMPVMDGYAAARAIRTVADSSRLPIFAITADGPGVPHARLREAGMQGLLHKPLEVERLLGLLQGIQTPSA